MMQLHSQQTDTGQIEELNWTSNEPLSQLDFLDAHGNVRGQKALPPLSRPPRDPTAPPEPTGGPKTPAGPS